MLPIHLILRVWSTISINRAKFGESVLTSPLKPYALYTVFTWDRQQSIIAQSVKCLVTDAKLTADPGVASSIPARVPYFRGD